MIYKSGDDWKNDKKCIVLLTDCFADLAGGAEKQIYELAKGIDKSKYEVFVVSLDCYGKASKEVIESTGSKLHIFRVVRVYGITGLIQGIRFYQFLKRHRIDILLTYHFSSDMWGTFWGHMGGVQTIISNRRDMGFWRNKWHVMAYRLINPWVHKIVAVSKSIKEMVMKTEGALSSKIEVIYNGVHLPEEQKPVLKRTDVGLAKDDIVFMHVANLKPVKGHVYLLMAFAGVIEKYPHSKLVLIGKDEFDGKLHELVKFLCIKNNVLFLGKREDISNLLPLSDVCLLPSLSEGMSNAILEYMAAAKPVIATRVGGNPELIGEGVTGLLVQKENVQELKNAMMKLILNKSLCLEMGKNALRSIQNDFSMKDMILKYDGLFSCTSSPNTAPSVSQLKKEALALSSQE